MHVSLGICTRNRAKSLHQTMESVCRLEIPSGLRWETIVVDNGSRDSTREVLSQFQNRLPLRVQTERRIGLSHARNRFLDLASGELLLFTDDDVTLPQPWLVQYWSRAVLHPEISFFGGPIWGCFEDAVPSWISGRWKTLGDVYALNDLGAKHDLSVLRNTLTAQTLV